MKPKGKRLVLFVAAASFLTSALSLWLFRHKLAFFFRFEPLGKNEQGYREYAHRDTGIIFVRLPGGVFQMGSPESDAPNREEDEGPVHDVEMSPFLIAKFEVSQAEWTKVMESNLSQFRGDDLPVERVSWHDCREFCGELGFQLPSEAQWEYACRGGTTTRFHVGDKLTTDQANFNGWFPIRGEPKGVIRGKTLPVDSFEPNPFGLYNVCGNVGEWCEDVPDPTFYATPEARGPDPVNRKESTFRVFRGGGFRDSAFAARSADRYARSADSRVYDLGFRPVVPLDD